MDSLHYISAAVDASVLQCYLMSAETSAEHSVS